MKQMRARFLLTLFFIFVGTGCATHTSKWIEAQPIEVYPIRTTVEGISFAADPYDNPEKAKEGFYVDVCSKGFYPVHLIFENGTDNRVMVTRDTVELIDVQGNTYKPVRSNVMSTACEYSTAAYGALFLVAGILPYLSADEANRKMASDWQEKELAESSIILPGGKLNGFVYFQLPPGKTSKGSKLKLVTEALENKQKFAFDLKL